MGSEESTKSSRYRALIWANVALAALLSLFGVAAVAFLYKPGDTASYETADRYLQEMKKLSSQGLFAVTEEVDHMYHYLTNTNDDDGHIIMDTSLLSKEDAYAALAGEEPVPENHPMAAKSRIEQGGATTMDLELPEEEEPEDSDGRSAAREEERVAELQLEEENPQEQETEGHELEGEVEEEEVTEEQREELRRLEEQDKKAERVAALNKEAMALMEMGAPDLIVPMARLQEKREAAEDEAAEVKGDGKDARFIEVQMVKRKASHKSHPVCGAMPGSFGPKFSLQREPPQGKTKFYPSKDGSVMPMNLQMKQIKVPTEHGKRGSRKATNKRALKNGEQALVDCLNNLGKCNSQSMRAALGIRGMKEALSGSSKLLSKKYDNCAVVGNSGGMMHHQYGKYIDVHDYVMRINALPMDGPNGRRDHLGSKVDGRVLSYKISKDVCCIKKEYAADNKALEYFIWFPAAQKQVAMRMKKKLKTNPVRMMQKPFVKSAVLVFKAFRGELLRLGYGPFEDWEYMTSGMHAVLGMIRSCENLDVYGFTTDLNKKGPYWFTGRASPPRSGQTQHAWDHERMVLRLLHAAGAVNLCTT